MAAPKAVSGGRPRAGKHEPLSWFDVDRQLEIVGVSEMEARILEAARRCYLQFGPAKMSLNDVANMAGVSRGSVYNYYSNRETLLRRVINYATATFEEDLDGAMAKSNTFEDQVCRAAELLELYLRRRPHNVSSEHFATLQATLYSTPFLTQIMGVIRGYLSTARARGEVRRKLDLDRASEWVARFLLSLVHTPAVSFHPDDPDDLNAYIRDFVVKGLD
jgi:AcrR family transcriptional regulator